MIPARLLKRIVVSGIDVGKGNHALGWTTNGEWDFNCCVNDEFYYANRWGTIINVSHPFFFFGDEIMMDITQYSHPD